MSECANLTITALREELCEQIDKHGIAMIAKDAEIVRLREALAECTVPIQVLAAQIALKPYAEISSNMQRDIIGAAKLAYDTLKATNYPGLPDSSREDRAIAWVAERLGAEHATPKERAAVLLWEAVELAQAEGVPWHTSCDLLAHVFDRPIGIPQHEAANVAFALYAYAASRGLSVAALFDSELARNQARSAEDLAASVARKDEAGI